jgi:hypothetical protein
MPAQLGYLKMCLRRTLVATRLIVANEENEDEGNGIVEPYLASSERFHNIKFKEPNWPMDSNYRGFQEIIDDYLVIKIIEFGKKSNVKPYVLSLTFQSFVKSYPNLIDEFKQICERSSGWRDAKRKSNIEREIYNQIGRNYIIQKLNENTDSLNVYVQKFQTIILSILRTNGYIGIISRRNPRVSITDDNERIGKCIIVLDFF